MDKQPVGQLPDLASSNNDDEIMVITNSEYNQLKKEKIADFITDLASTDENNAIVKGADGKLFTKDFGNASNITEGTLPVSVLPDIPKDKLPQIETDDLPDSGITAGTYTYPTDIVVNSKGQVTSITEGQAGENNANQDLSNLGPLGLDKLNQSKALETGSISSDADVYADVLKYAHSTFDKSKFKIVGSPNITDDGIASGFESSNYIECNKISFKNSFKIEGLKFTTGQISGFQDILDFIYSKITAGMPSIRINNGQLLVTYYSTVGAESIVIYDKLKVNTKYNLSIEYTNNQLTGTLIEDDNLPVLIAKSVNTMGDTTDKWFIGAKNNGNKITNPFYGSIDLKSIAIWADGVPVFNGNKTGTDTINDIEIPYTLSKTGSKIVDVAYRDRVQDLYEQTGEALFYTIDEENQDFTLPAGDIYGMIEKSRNGKMPVGTIFAHTCSADFVPENSLPCDGSEYTESQFPNLYVDWLISGRLNTCTYEEYQQDITTYSKCAKFAIDTVNHTFKVPTIPNGTFIQQAMSDDELGKAYNAGLPNIKGSFDGVEGNGTPEGCFYPTEIPAIYSGASGRGDYKIGFNASLSNPIYNNSDTVQPEAVALRYFVVVATDTINQSVMDWSEWATGLQTKLNADHSNDTKPYIIESYENDLNGYITYSNGLHIEYGVNNIPADGNGNVTLIKQYKNTNYLIFTSLRDISFNIGKDCGTGAMPLTEGSFTIRQSVQNAINVQWHTLGYINLGE